MLDGLLHGLIQILIAFVVLLLVIIGIIFLIYRKIKDHKKTVTKYFSDLTYQIVSIENIDAPEVFQESSISFVYWKGGTRPVRKMYQKVIYKDTNSNLHEGIVVTVAIWFWTRSITYHLPTYQS